MEGQDFQVLSRFARRLSQAAIGNRSDFAVVPLEGFNPERARNLKAGMEETLGAPVVAAVILDRDYRSDAECESIAEKCRQFCDFVEILKRKEIENFLLVPSAIDRAAARKVADRATRTGTPQRYQNQAEQLLSEFATMKRPYVASQTLMARRHFERIAAPHLNEATVTQSSIEEFEALWNSDASRLNLLPGKEALSAINSRLQQQADQRVRLEAAQDQTSSHNLASVVPERACRHLFAHRH